MLVLVFTFKTRVNLVLHKLALCETGNWKRVWLFLSAFGGTIILEEERYTHEQYFILTAPPIPCIPWQQRANLKKNCKVVSYLSIRGSIELIPSAILAQLACSRESGLQNKSVSCCHIPRACYAKGSTVTQKCAQYGQEEFARRTYPVFFKPKLSPVPSALNQVLLLSQSIFFST